MRMLVQVQEDDLMLANEERRKRIWHNDGKGING